MHWQVTSFSDNEEREEPASQSEIVVEAEVRFCGLKELQRILEDFKGLQEIAKEW